MNMKKSAKFNKIVLIQFKIRIEKKNRKRLTVNKSSQDLIQSLVNPIQWTVKRNQSYLKKIQSRVNKFQSDATVKQSSK